MKSEFGKITGVQLLNALYYFVGTLTISVVGYFNIAKIPTLEEFLPLLGTALTPALLSIFKSYTKTEK